MLTFPRIEGHEMPSLPHDKPMEYFMGVSVLFHKTVTSSVTASKAIKVWYMWQL